MKSFAALLSYAPCTAVNAADALDDIWLHNDFIPPAAVAAKAAPVTGLADPFLVGEDGRNVGAGEVDGVSDAHTDVPVSICEATEVAGGAIGEGEGVVVPLTLGDDGVPGVSDLGVVPDDGVKTIWVAVASMSPVKGRKARDGVLG